MNLIITIGREYGSGGRFIGRLVAEKLGIKFYDQELIEEAAHDSGISEQVIETYDETKSVFLSSNYFTFDMPLSYKAVLAQFDAISKIAAKESCVIVGRCADYILSQHEQMVSVFICAPMEEKIKRAVTYYGIDEKKAASVINKKNKSRKGYYNYFTDKEWGKAQSYDLCINSKIGVEETANGIIAYVQSRFKYLDFDNLDK